ncbi:hypothetical protein JAAARDRAFT_53079 [Jaapia argillacea MUCL 33604]|uniref:Uncharacterized protein n=1 Tax=Jaapia argillacea MUCL 33604 TaxID=933084 RepID=A0A067QE49_9AGAM|nr:hypothetical protein JAAARDRAFT_53079 [Jaapia argillacea MUCL 33604]
MKGTTQNSSICMTQKPPLWIYQTPTPDKTPSPAPCKDDPSIIEEPEGEILILDSSDSESEVEYSAGVDPLILQIQPMSMSTAQMKESVETPSPEMPPSKVEELDKKSPVITPPIPEAFLNPTANEEDVPEDEPVQTTVTKLLKEANKFKSLTSLMHLHTVKNFIDLHERYMKNPQVKSLTIKASYTGLYFACKIHTLYWYIIWFCILPPTNAGKHHTHPTLLNNEHMTQVVHHYLMVLADSEITPLLLMKQVNSVIIPSLGLDLGGKKISESAVRRWLVKLAYRLKDVRKGMYVDGHKWEDVVEYQRKFLATISENERLQRTYNNKILEPIKPVLRPGKRLHIPIFHDESIFHVNDLCHRVWVKDGKMPLHKKGQGWAIHVSDFILEQTGQLVMSESQRVKNKALDPSKKLPCMDAHQIIYLGKNHDGWWNIEQLIGPAVADFLFDQSSAYGEFTKDALNVKEMNVRPGRGGGQQHCMHATIIPYKNLNPEFRGKPQGMGQAKGMLWVLEERGLVLMLKEMNGGKLVRECKVCKLSREAHKRLLREAQVAAERGEEPADLHEDILQASMSNMCCMQKALATQQDFKDEKPLLQVVINEVGHKYYFLPKLHCELNPIEMHWGWAKALTADGTFPTAKHLVPKILNACPTNTIQAFFCKLWCYIDAYRKGLNAKQAEFVVKKYQSHC